MTEDNPIASHYRGVATLEQMLTLLRANVRVRRPQAIVNRGIISKSSLYDVLKDHRRVSVATLEKFCDAYDVDIMVAVRKKP